MHVGDVNGDGYIDDADIDVLDAYIAGTDTAKFFVGGPFFTAADLNGDGKIDAADREILQNYWDGEGDIDQRGPGYAS